MGYTNSYKSIASCVRSIKAHCRNSIAAVCTTNGGKTYFHVEHALCVEYRMAKGHAVKIVHL